MSRILGVTSTSNDTSIFDLPVYEGYSVESKGDRLIMQESYGDQLEIMKAIWAADNNSIQLEAATKRLVSEGTSESDIAIATQELTVLQEASLRGVWESIKAFFKKLWGKIVAFFKSALVYVQSWVMSGKKFIAANKKKLEAAKGKVKSDVEFEAYDYDLGVVIGRIDKAGDSHFKSTVSTAVNKLGSITPELSDARAGEIEKQKDYYASDAVSGRIDEVRGHIAGEGSGISSDEYREKLFSALRGGASSKASRKTYSAGEIYPLLVEALEDKEGIEKKIGKFKKDVDDLLKAGLKLTDDAEKKYAKGSDATGDNTSDATRKANSAAVVIVRGVAAEIRSESDVYLTAVRAVIGAFKERGRAYKSIAASIISKGGFAAAGADSK